MRPQSKTDENHTEENMRCMLSFSVCVALAHLHIREVFHQNVDLWLFGVLPYFTKTISGLL